MKKKLIFIYLISAVLLTGCDGIGSKDLMESIESPNGKYIIKTYLNNCGATCDFGVSAELCDTNNNCKEIYDCYHENTSFVYWIDNENVFINQKILNIFKDTYHSMDYDNAFRLSKNIDYYQSIYLINRDNYEYKLSGYDVDYISEKSTSMYTFDKNNTYDNDYDFIMKIVNLENNETTKYFVKIDKNKMYILNNDKLSELNRTDYEYLKQILISNNLYSFN